MKQWSYSWLLCFRWPRYLSAVSADWNTNSAHVHCRTVTRRKRCADCKTLFNNNQTAAKTVKYNCRLTNYKLLRWLVETPSRDFEHYRMTDDSRSRFRDNWKKNRLAWVFKSCRYGGENDLFSWPHDKTYDTHSSWDMEIGRPSVEDVTRGRMWHVQPRFFIFRMSHSLMCVIC